MTRGFITIATGKEQYYKIAANLVKSYKFFSKNPLPFAVIAEEENEYTALFDDVIITNESKHSFMDKFLLLKHRPYDENIFIDADSLAFGDLNVYWDFFEGTTDFSALGIDTELHATEGTWYYAEDVWKYTDMITYKSRVHAGVMFIRNTQKIDKLYNDCCDIYSNFDKLHFHTCPNSYDECTLGVAMPMNNMHTTRENPNLFAAYPFLTDIKADMFNGRISYSSSWAGHTENGLLMHFGTSQTYKPFYRFLIKCLELMIAEKNGKPMSLMDKILYKYKLSYYVNKVVYEITRFFKRVGNKIFKLGKDI